MSEDNDKKKNNDKEFEEKDVDLTKDVFYDDLINIEDDIIDEAIGLVEHALNLVETNYYDDAIEILRQAVGLYSQIGRNAEINAINEKISEIYLKKEQFFRESEKKLIKVPKEVLEGIAIEEEEIKEPIKEDIDIKGKKLIEEAQKLIEIDEFDEALERYEDAIKIYKEAGKESDMEHVFELIETCYSAKAKYKLQKEEKVATSVFEENKDIKLAPQSVALEEGEISEKLKLFEGAKKKEENISEKAYKLMEKAAKSAEVYDFDNAINVYNEAKAYFQQVNWTHEIQKIDDSIAELLKQKEMILKELEKKKELGIVDSEKKTKEEALLKEEIKRNKEIKEISKIKKIEQIEKKKEIKEDFEKDILELVNQAEKMVRDYEVEIRKKNFQLKPPYNDVIVIYQNIHKKLLTKGWNNQAEIYSNQIKIYQQKLEKDKKLREIEARKQHKEDLYHKSLRVEEIKPKEVLNKEKIKLEDQTFQNKILEMVNNAEKLAREYELDKKRYVKKGKFSVELSKYPNIIEIYTKIKNMLLEKGWKTEVNIYENQIKIYENKLENDKKLSEVEARKIEKDMLYHDSLKLKPEKSTGLSAYQKKKLEEEELQNKISETIDNAEKMARDYDLAIRYGNFEAKCPYQEIIKIYEEIYKQLIQKNWKDQAKNYTNQIVFYKEKLEKDKKLREIESQKRNKDNLYQENLKTDRFKKGEIEKIISYEQRRKEEENFENEVTEKVIQAQNLEREYEIEIKKGNFDIKSPYPEIIEIYTTIRQKLIEKGWTDQAKVYSNQIEITRKKMEKLEKIKKVETKKKEKKKEYLEALKIEPEVSDKIRKLEILNAEYKQEEDFQEKIIIMINNAEKMARDYELEIRKGNFENKAPYQEIIAIYQDIHKKLIEKGWTDQAKIYLNQIGIYQEKLESDKKLRVLEKQKIQKQKEYEDLLKAKKDDKTLAADLENLKNIELVYQEELEEENFENQITELVNKADAMVRNYELAIRYGQFENECIYPKAIDIYKEIKLMLNNRGWNEEARIYTNQIKLYEEKIENDNKLRQIEELKHEKDIEYLESLKTKKQQEIGIKKGKTVVEKKKEDDLFQEELLERINQAEKIARDYELAIRYGNFEAKCPYPEIIEIYKDIYDKLLKRGWKQQALIYKQQVEIYNDKLESDKKLHEIEAKKAEKNNIYKETLKVKVEGKGSKKQQLEEFELKKKQKDKTIIEAFELIDKAENLVKNYDLMLKTEILQTESPFDKVIELYRDARKLFLENDWETEASKLNNTIKFYKDRKENDGKLRIFEAKKLAESQARIEAPKIEKTKGIIDKKQMILELEKEKKDKEKSSSEVFKLIDEAEKLAKNYELKLKEGIFLDCPYEKVIEIYREARKSFQEINWEDQANKLVNTINYYKEKLESDKKLRVLEAEKIEKQKKELKNKLSLAEKTRKEKEAKLKEREKALLLKSREKSPFETQKDRAFRLMDQAKSQYNLHNYDLAIKLYKESEEIFSSINWATGMSMVKESIQMIKNIQKESEDKLKKLEEQKEKELHETEKFEEDASKIQALKKKEVEERREELLKIQLQKEQEKEQSDRAFDLLEQGTRLLKRKKFDEAENKYISARDIFQQIGWNHEVSRINNDLLLKIKMEENKGKKLEAYRIKKLKEKEEFESLLNQAEQQKEIGKLQAKEIKEDLIKIKIADRLKGKIKEIINDANLEIIKFKYNEGILKLKEAVKMMDKMDLNKEIKEINEQIETLKNESNVPLIVLEDFDENEENFMPAYIALDKAQISLMKKKYMKAISELNESKFHLEKVKNAQNLLNAINDKILSIRAEIKEKKDIEVISEDLKEKEPKRIQLEKESSFRQKRRELEEKETELKKEEEEFKNRIASKREARRKRIKELMEK